MSETRGSRPDGAGAARSNSGLPLPPVPRKPSVQERKIIERYRKAGPEGAGSPLGKWRNAPNTAIGLAYGLMGHVAGKAAGRRSRIGLGGNAVQFFDNPFGGVSAVTLGNATIWNGDPHGRRGAPDPGARIWHDAKGNPELENGHTLMEHERQHTLQGEMLGALYLPSNLLGGLNALGKGEAWHGAGNWNETGPMDSPSRPWKTRRP